MYWWNLQNINHELLSYGQVRFELFSEMPWSLQKQLKECNSSSINHSFLLSRAGQCDGFDNKSLLKNSQRSVVRPQVNAVSVLNKFHRTKEEERDFIVDYIAIILQIQLMNNENFFLFFYRFFQIPPSISNIQRMCDTM